MTRIERRFLAGYVPMARFLYMLFRREIRTKRREVEKQVDHEILFGAGEPVRPMGVIYHR